MKTFFALILVSLAATTSFAADCVTKDGVTLADGTSTVLYHTAQPRKEFGPNYSCAGSARIRTCNNGALSVIPRECSQYDSGGCVDNWEDRLEDNQFVFARCED